MKNPKGQTKERETSAIEVLLALAIGVGAAILAGYLYGSKALANVNSMDALTKGVGILACISLFTLAGVMTLVLRVSSKLFPGKPKAQDTTPLQTAEEDQIAKE